VIVSAFAKINLSLRVRPRDAAGYHPLRSLVQSIAWADRLTLEPADEDDFAITGDLPAEEDNLAWQAATAVRRAIGVRRGMRLHLEKHIAVAAGLGGGSADAAAGLVAATGVLRGPAELPSLLAPTLGSDVPFCLVGGTAWMEGRGEVITAVPLRPDYALAVAVPPFELSTAAVYRRWDQLDGPAGPALGGRHLPPSLRAFEELGNDLLPAATSLHSDLADWMSDLAARWERPVQLTGSGPACFGLFADDTEAADAVRTLTGARALWSGAPMGVGVRVEG
jgi:4-diphosphocytidyl-2-C-methyl-D-erythritol kinase